MTQKFIINGRKPLKGTMAVSGSKNAALPLIAASILASSPVELSNVPDIQDVNTMLKILAYLGAKTEWVKPGVIRIDCAKLCSRNLPHELVCKLRASILLISPLLARFGKAKMAYPGGCVIGKRPLDAHLDTPKYLGAKVKSGKYLQLSAKQLKGTRIIIEEVSVTGTESAIMAAVTAKGETELVLAAMEPHVQDLCRFLNKMGAKIRGIGTHILKITGVRKLKGVRHKVIADYIELGTFAIAAALVPKSKVTITGGNPEDLEALWNKFREIGVNFSIKDKNVTVKHTPRLKPCRKLITRVHPGFPTDLQAPFGLLLTQAPGVVKVFETIFEGRLNYLFELEKMGARVEILNPHQAIVIGPTKLRGANVTSCDLRAGATLVLAALAAQGTSEVAHIDYIDRGYEAFEEKLKGLGARIRRVAS